MLCFVFFSDVRSRFPISRLWKIPFLLLPLDPSPKDVSPSSQDQGRRAFLACGRSHFLSIFSLRFSITSLRDGRARPRATARKSARCMYVHKNMTIRITPRINILVQLYSTRYAVASCANAPCAKDRLHLRSISRKFDSHGRQMTISREHAYCFQTGIKISPPCFRERQAEERGRVSGCPTVSVT